MSNLGNFKVFELVFIFVREIDTSYVGRQITVLTFKKIIEYLQIC